MSAETIDLEKLGAPFSPERVHWRVGSLSGDKTRGLALAYIDARDVQDRLDEVVGPERWRNRYEFHGDRIICELELRCEEEWVYKSDGAGTTDIEGEKGGLSDAFKRAAVHWGIGRYLYRLESPWVDVEQRGRTFVIAKHERDRLRAYLTGEAPAPGDGEPEPSAPPRKKAAPATKGAPEKNDGSTALNRAQLGKLYASTKAAEEKTGVDYKKIRDDLYADLGIRDTEDLNSRPRKEANQLFDAYLRGLEKYDPVAREQSETKSQETPF